MTIFTRDTHLQRPAVNWLLSLLICIFFYFVVAGLCIINLLPVLINPLPEAAQEIAEPLGAITLRTLCAYVSVWICCRWLLRKPFRSLIASGGMPILAPFFATMLLWIALLLIKELALAFINGHTLQWNAAGFATYGNTMVILILSSLVLVPLHALGEELIYRTIPMRGFGYVVNRNWFIILISTVLFWLNHGGLLSQASYWLPVGIILGIVVVLSGNIVYTWAIHTGFNLFTASIVGEPIAGDVNSTLLLRSTNLPDSVMYADVACLIVMLMILIIWKRWKLTTQVITGRVYA